MSASSEHQQLVLSVDLSSPPVRNPAWSHRADRLTVLTNTYFSDGSMTYHSTPMTETVFYVVPTIAEYLVRAGSGHAAVRDQLVRRRPCV